MRNRNKLFTGFVLTALTVVMSVAIVVAEEPPKIDASTPIEELQTLAPKGNGDAMLELGERLVQGQGVDTNTTVGLQWIQKAADAGNKDDWYDLGVV
jgi:TPR repeat protein